MARNDSSDPARRTPVDARSPAGPRDSDVDRGRSPHDSDSRAFVVRVATTVAIAIALVGAALVVGFAYDVFLLTFAAILIAILLRGLARLLARHAGLDVRWALGVVALLLVGVPFFAAWLAYPRIGNEVAQLADALPGAVDSLEKRVAEVNWLRPLLDRLPAAASIAAPRGDVLGRITGFFSTTFGLFANLLIVIAVGAYLATDATTYRDGFVRLFRPRMRPVATNLLNELGTTLGWWLAAKFASMAVIGALTWIGLVALGVPLAAPLALIAALLTFIPNLGPLLSVVPAMLLALVQSPLFALYVMLLYAGIQLVESYLITPLIQKRMVSLPPALTIVVQLLAGVLAGGLGLLVAAPLTVAGLVLVRRLYLDHVLGEREDPMGPG
jgi:predicted PurR-regulated permease PerM